MGLVTAALALAVTIALTGCSAESLPGDSSPTIAAPAIRPSEARTPLAYIVAPDGTGWVASEAFEGEPDPDPAKSMHRFESMREAIDWAASQPSEFGVRVAG